MESSVKTWTAKNFRIVDDIYFLFTLAIEYKDLKFDVSVHLGSGNIAFSNSCPSFVWGKSIDTFQDLYNNLLILNHIELVNEYGKAKRQYNSSNTKTKETKPMVRTSYDLHVDSQGNNTLIAALPDDHLKNIVSYLANKMLSAQNQLNQSSSPMDAMSREILGQLKADQIARLKNGFLNDWQLLTVYTFELFVIRGVQDVALQVLIQEAVGRNTGLQLPGVTRTLSPVVEVVEDDSDPYI